MATTTWDNDIYPGGSETYDEEALTYDQSTSYKDAGLPRYDTIGITTSWTNEDL